MTKTCPVCSSDMVYVKHVEPDGVTEYGSDESYYVCPFDCNEEEIDTCTEFNVVKVEQDKGSVVL